MTDARNITRTSMLVAASLLSGVAAAQAFPVKPITFVSPFPPGGGNDLISRSVAVPMTKDLGQNVVVDNRPGAETSLGMSSVAREVGCNAWCSSAR